MKSKIGYLILLLSLVCASVWFAVFSHYDKDSLKIISCDVGQGDATLMIYQDFDVLVDGGPNDKVLDCLSQYLPYYDKEIEVVILTHPESDHFGGLADVFVSYKVDKFLANDLDNSSQNYQVLKNVVGGSGADISFPKEGTIIRYGLLYLDILNPSEEYFESHTQFATDSASSNVLGAYSTRDDLNSFSLVALVGFGNFDALLTGDIMPPQINNLESLLEKNFPQKHIEYIKIPHHGSKNGITESLLKYLHPDLAVISVGKNQWGHPNSEVLNLLKKYSIKYLRTDEGGNIVVITNGKNSFSVVD